MISRVMSLRVNECLMLDLTRIGEEAKNRKKHKTKVLKGKEKGESLERDHLFPCARVIASGLDVALWTNFLIAGHKTVGR